jgi:hypothetical protein
MCQFKSEISTSNIPYNAFQRHRNVLLRSEIMREIIFSLTENTFFPYETQNGDNIGEPIQSCITSFKPGVKKRNGTERY